MNSYLLIKVVNLGAKETAVVYGAKSDMEKSHHPTMSGYLVEEVPTNSTVDIELKLDLVNE